MKISHLLSQTQRLVGVAVAVIIISTGSVSAVFAESVADCTPPNPSTPGVHVPTGSEAGMYHFDCEQQLWVSAHYTYDPLTGVTNPLDQRIYKYNPASGQWDYDSWVYVASKGDYALRTFSVSAPPAGATVVGGPTSSVSTPTTATAQGTPGSGATVANTSNGNATAVAVTNSVTTIATSGGASVTANTSGGSATSGDAAAMATLINMLQSSGNVFGSDGNAVVFNTTISGDVTGDILLDPSLIGSLQPSNAPASTPTDTSGLAYSTADMAIDNTLSVAASSGDALVAANTQAGSATTGSATAVANVLNFLNSTIVSGKSFLGIINIDGNFNGDILLPPNFIDELLASNVPTLSVSAPVSSTGVLDTSVSQSINNAVTATSKSGAASVDMNTTAGSATSGNGTTNITTFNLTGNTVVGKNALLVFVNVLGTWYGLIFNAPSGATAATIGGDITTASPEGNTTTIGQYDTSQTINNTIVASAESGDASVTKNTSAGSATTGDANVAINILNVAQSALSLSDWFGVLFINVFGSWTGSFGIDTIAGTVTPPPSTSSEEIPANTAAPAVFRFIPKPIANVVFRGTPTSSAEGTSDISNGTVLAAQHTKIGDSSSTNKGQKQKSLAWMYATFLGIWIVLLAAERVYSKLRRNT